MDFGRTVQIEEADLSLPPDDPLTDLLWQQLKDVPRTPPQIYIGCTEWGRKNWIGKIYPQGTKDRDFLAHYVKQFNSIELNALFYNLQPKEVIQRWASLAGPEFRFCPKYSNTISHYKQLQQAERDTDLFLDHMLSFGDKLGYSFLQLSERFASNRAEVLQKYVRHLPRDFHTCVELRHEDWFGKDPRAKDTWQLFHELGIGTVLTDTQGRRDCLHMKLTAPVAFIRYVGNNLHPTDYLRLDAWIDRISTWIGKGLREVYIFLHNPEEQMSPEMAAYLAEQFNTRLGTHLKIPKLPGPAAGTNLSLF